MKLSTLLVVSAAVATFCVPKAEAQWPGCARCPWGRDVMQDDESLGYGNPRPTSWQQASRFRSWNNQNEDEDDEDDDLMFDDGDDDFDGDAFGQLRRLGTYCNGARCFYTNPALKRECDYGRAGNYWSYYSASQCL